MKPKLSIPTTVSILLFAFGIFTLPVWLSACASKPPSPWEQHYFNFTTNPPVVTVQTNVIPITVYRTNEVTQTVTNVQGVTQLVTNLVPVQVTAYLTNTVAVTNPPTYNATPNQTALQPIKDTAGAVGNIFGVGGIATTAVSLLAGLWAWVRSKKTYTTAANLAQVIETTRSFIQQLPNGQTYDAALVQWMQGHQAETGTLQQVVDLLANEVSNRDAVVAAEHVRQTIAALGVTLPPASPKV